jgi:cytochrome c6
MRLRFVVAATLLAGAAGAAANDDGRKLFTSVTPSCALCHTLKDAGAAGQIGPSLDELKPDRDRVLKALKNGIGQMPAFRHLSEAEMQALAVYLEQATK